MATRKRNALPATKATAPRITEPTPPLELRGRAPAPVRPDPVVSNPPQSGKDAIAKARAGMTREAEKAAREAERAALVARLSATAYAPKRAELESLPGALLAKVAKARGVMGYSGLAKGEMVELLLTGSKPAPKAGSARDYRARAKDAKAKGLITGPVSSLKAAELREAVAKAEKGEAVTVAKPAKGAPKPGTADYHRDLLRNGQAKGYDAGFSAKAKELFKASISALKAAQLRDLCQALGLVK